MSENSSANRPVITLRSKVFHISAAIAWVFFVFSVVQIGIVMFLEATKGIGFQLDFGNRILSILVLNAIIYILALAVVVGVPYLMKLLPEGLSIKRLLGVGKVPKPLSTILLVMGSYLVYLLISADTMLIISQLVPGFQVDQEQDIGFKTLTSSYEFIFAFLALVVMAPLAEELLFRGYLFGRLRSYVSFIPAAIITSLLFGLVHWQWNVGIDVFILSLALCYLRERTESLWSAIFLHATKNGIAFMLLFAIKTPLT